MNITKALPYLVVVLLAFFALTNDAISSALINFLMAGVIPGTSLQLPWYLVLVLVPLLLFGTWALIRSIDFVPKDWVAPEKTVAKKGTTNGKKSHARKTTSHKSKKKKQTSARAASRKRSQKKLSSALNAG